ncbi:MAG: N-6 DNA methylase [Eubacteriaceae bacterium]|nr:N-6 DNA methylase [Eubacteriaceae bacterium]
MNLKQEAISTSNKTRQVLQSPLLAVKIAFLKILHDRGYFNVASHLDDIIGNFTFDYIISIWSKAPSSIYPETAPNFTKRDKSVIRNFILDENKNSTLSSELVLGEIYIAGIPASIKKEYGITYTPESILEYFASVMREDIRASDKILDPSSGCGNFLIAFYRALMNKFYTSESATPIKILHTRILEDNIYGIESSREARFISVLSLALLNPDFVECKNIYAADSLIEADQLFEPASFDWVVTNPPYIGHKKVTREYKIELYKKYSSVYYDKADVHYCFFALASNMLRYGGHMLFITSRYFLESQSADKLREYLLSSFTFQTFIDYYGIRPFEGIGIDPLIIHATKVVFKGNVFNAKRVTAKDFDLIANIPGTSIDMEIVQDSLAKGGFSICTPDEQDIAKRVKELCTLELSDICESFQGIISGCDQAFIVSETNGGYEELIKECGVKWLKGKNITELGTITPSDLWLLYVDDTSQLTEIEKTLARLWDYREKLESRREVRTGARNWYALQWPRSKGLFEQPKIIFPYKCHKNKFAFDGQGHFFSADIYAMVASKNAGNLDLHKLALLLSSDIYDTYFKTFAKKLGGKLYEYYPNTVMRMMVPKPEIINSFESAQDITNYFMQTGR